MTNCRSLALVGFAALLALSLAACTPTPVAPSPSPTAPSAVAAPTESATPTPSATAEPEPETPTVNYGAAPKPRVPVSCDGLATAEQRAVAAGVAADTIVFNPLEMSLGHAASRQGGSLSCYWDGPSTGEEGNVMLIVEVIPDAAKQFKKASAESELPAAAGFGGDSRISCVGYGKAFGCDLKFLVDRYWVEVSLTGAAKEGTATSKLNARVKGLGSAIRDSLAFAGPPAAPFVAPAGSLKVWDSCAVLDDSKKFRSALASPGLTTPEAGDFTDGIASYLVGFQRGGLAECTWRQKNTSKTPAGQVRQVGIDIVPGAGWVWPEVLDKAANPTEGLPKGSSVTVAGADEAIMSCWDDSECSLEALVDGSYLEVNMSFEKSTLKQTKAAAVDAMEFAIATLT